MTIIIFLIDTSASMNQRAYYSGTQTLLDVAKSAVEMFFKTRQKSFESRGDRYMLLDFEDPPSNIKAGWKENLSTFMNELRNLECNGLTVMGSALKNTFDLLNLNRMQTGIDTYGQGRCPFYLEPSVIIVITDGGKLLSNNNVTDDFNLPMHSPIPGSELTREPFRWDQRLFALVLRMTGPPALDRDMATVPNDPSPIDAMCEVTGGRSYYVTSKIVLNQCVESLCQKLTSGVVINFEKSGPDPPLISVIPAENNVPEKNENPMASDANHLKIIENDWSITNGRSSPDLNRIQSLTTISNWQNCRKMIYVTRSSAKGFAVGFWPIPEAFWPELLLGQLPPRSAHPVIKFTCSNQEPLTIENLPFDKYEVESSPLTQFILLRKQPTFCWQVFVANSYKNPEIVHPFGYLKASTNLTCVNLFVMPYNYPVLLPLLDDLFKVHRLKPTPEWRNAFQSYLKTMPAYYAGPLRRALVRMGVPNQLAQTLIPEQTENSLSYTIVNYLKRIKSQAKVEFDRLCNEVQARQAQKQQQQQQQSFLLSGTLSSTARLINRNPFKHELLSHPVLQKKFAYLNEQLNEFNGFVVGIETKKSPSIKNYSALNNYRNPFDIQRSNLERCVKRMRQNFMQTNAARIKLFDEDFLHSMPVSQMGNYQEYLRRQAPPLRELESVPVRQHMFGNPFKIDKRMMMMVDEADIDNIGNSECPVNSNTTVTSVNKTGANQIKGAPGSIKRTVDPITGIPVRPKRKQGPLPKDFTIQKTNFQKLPVFNYPSEQMDSDVESDAGSDLVENAVKTSIVFGELMAYNNDNSDIVDDVVDTDYYPGIEYEPNMDAMADTVSLINNNMNIDPPVLVNQNENILLYGSKVDAIVDNQDVINKKYDHGGKPKKKKRKKTSKNLSLKDLKRHNLNVRKLIFKYIRRPGQDFTLLFDQLKELKGSIEIQIEYLHQIIEESKKFKRKKLILQLEQFMKTKLIS